jgi:ATP-dependent protease Clp ATPase subunit
MADIECSFCGTSVSKEEAKHRFVAGSAVFVCRDCVDMMIGIFCENDQQWGERTIQTIKAKRKAT